MTKHSISEKNMPLPVIWIEKFLVLFISFSSEGGSGCMTPITVEV